MTEYTIQQYPNFGELQAMSRAIAASKMFGVANEDQAMALMLLCQAEGLHPVMALRRYHIIDGKPAFRADALQGEFEKEGAILWHQRDERMCAATFFRDKHKVDEERARERFKRMIGGASVSDQAAIGEVTIIRTFQDAMEKKVAMRWDQGGQKWVMKHNWQQSPRQMLHARCLTEGVRAINPGLVAGVYTEDEILDIPKDENNGERAAPVEIIERNVRQATANTTATNDEIPGVPAPAPITEVTKDNYKELVVHIGKAEGEMLGKKVGELHPNIIEWLYTKWRDKLTPMSSEQDMRLKAAVEYAYAESKSVVSKGGDADFPHQTEASSPAVSDRDKLIKELQERCNDLVITEAQACGYLRQEGVFTTEQSFADASTKLLELLTRPDMWQALNATVEAHLKPPVVQGGPAKKKPRKGDLRR